jgi:hypothetical protein
MSFALVAARRAVARVSVPTLARASHSLKVRPREPGPAPSPTLPPPLSRHPHAQRLTPLAARRAFARSPSFPATQDREVAAEKAWSNAEDERLLKSLGKRLAAAKAATPIDHEAAARAALVAIVGKLGATDADVKAIMDWRHKDF